MTRRLPILCAIVSLLPSVPRAGGAVAGRYVRLELPRRATPLPDGRILSVSEIQIFSGGANIAPRGTATASPGRTPAQVAVDGNTDGKTNFTHSDVGAVDPWIEIDLGGVRPIERITVINRADRPERLRGFLVTVLDADRGVAWHRRYRRALRTPMTIEPAPRDGSHDGTVVAHGAVNWYDVTKETAADRGAFTTDTLLPTGDYARLRRQPVDPEKQPVVRLDLGRPDDATERMARFRARNDDEQVAALCRRLRRAVKDDVAGLAVFERCCREKRYRRALEAYRSYFFDKLKDPERYGAATRNIFTAQIRDRGRDCLIAAPAAFALEHILDGTAVHVYRGRLLAARIGPPGAVNWAPVDLAPPAGATYGRGPDRHPFWRTGPGKTLVGKIECCRAMNRVLAQYQGMAGFRALVGSYVVTGNRAHLRRWVAYRDDRALHARGDIDRCPADVRRATELETQAFRTHLALLRVMLDERPALAADYPAPSLARHLLRLLTDLPPYTIRAKRAELANWGIMGIGHLLHVASILNEFRAMDYYRREAWRLWRANFIQHRTLDGENREAWDQGHNGVDIGCALASVPYCRLPAGTDDVARREFWDLVRINERNLLVHMSPGGNYWPRWQPDGGFRALWAARVDPAHSSVTGRYLQPDADERHHLDLVYTEPGARRRIMTVVNGGKPGAPGLPDRFSDLCPYAAMYYLRDSWRPDAAYLLMQNVRYRSQDTAIRDVAGKNRLGGSARTMYALSKEAAVLVSASPIVVDRKPDNRWHGAIPTGGKTTVCCPSERHVVDTRFHTSPCFDLAEAKQDAPYCRPAVKIRGDWYGHYAPRPGMANTPVTDVTAYRRVFGVRGEGVYIVADRLENAGGAVREYTQFFTLAVKFPEKDLARRVAAPAGADRRLIEEDPGARRFRTDNSGLADVSVYLFGHDFRFANRLDRKLEHHTIEKSQVALMAQALARKKSPRTVIQKYTKRPVSARWSGGGTQVLVTLLCVRPDDGETPGGFENDLKACRSLDGTLPGCRAVTRAGTRIWFRTGPDRRNDLAAGPARAAAESLLAVERDGSLGGIVLGCRSLSIRGKTYDASGDFEYTLDAGGRLKTTAIHRPIDTVRIHPAANVFTDAVDVSFSIPGADTADIEYRYTLDGSEPTLASPRYTAPVTLRETTMVKVRPFRRGLEATPWHFTGTDAGRTITAIFRRRPLVKAAAAGETKPGLRYAYFEGDWPTLFAHAGCPGVLEPKKTGRAEKLLDPAAVAAVRETDGACAIRYTGYLRVPRNGVYTFYAPPHLYTPTMDAGYDLRVWIDGAEWLPAPRLHAENTWSVPLAAGLHRLAVSFVDYRRRPFKNEYWMPWRKEQMWQGIPALELSGPGRDRRPVDPAMLRCR